MDYAWVMQVTKPLNELAHNLNHVWFAYQIILEISVELATMDLFHHDVHPTFTLVDFSYFNDIGMWKQANNLNFVSQEFLLPGIKLSFVDAFESIGYWSAFVACFKNFRKFTTAQLNSLFVELTYWVEATVILEFTDPQVDDSLIFMKKHSFAETCTIMI